MTECNSSGNCIKGSSWNNHWWGDFKDAVGVAVRQGPGGFNFGIYLCGGNVICFTTTGSNTLSLNGTLFYDPGLLPGGGGLNPPPGWDPPPAGFAGSGTFGGPKINESRPNAQRIELSRYSYCFRIPTPFGAITGCEGNSDPDYTNALVGACEGNTSSSIPAFSATQDGRVGGDTVCPRPLGVTCNAGYTLCQGYICTTPSNDVNNCGVCGNVCPGGYSCQNGSCVAPPPPPPPPNCPSGYIDCNGDGTLCIQSPQRCP